MKIPVLLCFFSATLLVLPACRNRRTLELSPDQQNLVQAYVELTKLREIWPLHHPIYAETSQMILDNCGLTKESYEKQIAFFDEDPTRWEIFYAAVVERMKTAATDAAAPDPDRTIPASPPEP